jgi:hypothetical protein
MRKNPPLLRRRGEGAKPLQRDLKDNGNYEAKSDNFKSGLDQKEERETTDYTDGTEGRGERGFVRMIWRQNDGGMGERREKPSACPHCYAKRCR